MDRQVVLFCIHVTTVLCTRIMNNVLNVLSICVECPRLVYIRLTSILFYIITRGGDVLFPLTFVGTVVMSIILNESHVACWTSHDTGRMPNKCNTSKNSKCAVNVQNMEEITFRKKQDGYV